MYTSQIFSSDAIGSYNVNMSFIDITDPKRRDEIVKNYLATKKRIQQRNMNERAEDLAKEEDRNEMFRPIVDSSEKSSVKLHKELKELNKTLKPIIDIPMLVKKEEDEEGEIYFPNKYERIINEIPYNDLDQIFGMRKVRDKYILGSKMVTIDDLSNIIVDDNQYPGTDGLWKLIMEKIPITTDYSPADFRNYKDLAKDTQLLSHPNIESREGKPTRITSMFKHKLLTSKKSKGDGVHFLPSSIKGLSSKLNVLLAEYAAGNNTSTRTEIVSILDELKRRKRITQAEYNSINNFISKC